MADLILPDVEPFKGDRKAEDPLMALERRVAELEKHHGGCVSRAEVAEMVRRTLAGTGRPVL